MAKTCEECIYSQFTVGGPYTCHANPPAPVLSNQSNLTTVWPIVLADDWCAHGYNPNDGQYDAHPGTHS